MPERRRRNRLTRRFAVFGPAAIVVLSGALSVAALRRELAVRDWVFHTRDVMDASSSLMVAMLGAETAQRGFLLTHDTTFLGPYTGAPDRARGALTRLESLTRDSPSQQRRLDTLRVRVARRLVVLDSTISAERVGNTVLATGIIAHGPGRDLMTDIRRLVDSIDAQEERLLVERRSAELRSNEVTLTVLVLGTLVAGVLAFIVNSGFDHALRDRRKALEEAVAARAAAESANRAKASFLASMSHELRTPLNAALGFAALVRQGVYGAVNERQAEVLERVERSQTHLARLIDDILDFARLEAGRVRVRLEPLRVADVINDLGPLVEPQAAAKSIGLALLPPEESLRVAADRQRLQQILVNLVGNAIKFTPQDGTIRVGARNIDGKVHIQVQDTGVGIPRDRLQAIFEPFVQVDAELTRTASGAGLGLAISRDLARAMGGDITVESTVGEGSTFSVVLPMPGAAA